MSNNKPTAVHPSTAVTLTRNQLIFISLTAVGWAIVAAIIPDPQIARATFIAGLCITLWLSEIVPPYLPTFLLWALVPLLLQPINPDFTLSSSLHGSIEPILILFLGGFTLSVAASNYQLDAYLAQWVIQISHGRRVALLWLLGLSTAFLSMWMSNIAAAAMMIVALRPLTVQLPKDDLFRRGLLIAIALGANLGGMGTPISSGPNAIALAAIAHTHDITFIEWIAFALPLMVGLLVVGLAALLLIFRVNGQMSLPPTRPHTLPNGAKLVVAIFGLTIVAWLSEPWHGVGSAQVALLAMVLLFGTGLLKAKDLGAIDWSTLILISGGLGIGRLLESSGLIYTLTEQIPWQAISPLAQLAVLCLTSAILSALMSNTAATTMLVPLALSLDVPASAPILIAMAASVGIPFIISTPANSMVYGEGGVRSRDLLLVGLFLMVLGCGLIVLTGDWVLRQIGMF